jgi:DNA-binding response OmpR family regulator
MNVLVCDDDPEIGGFLRTTFELEGWTARLTASGEECLAAIDLAAPPDALVLDQVMPGLTGLETAAQLRDSGFARPIILCSGHLGPELNSEIERLELIPINKLDMDAVVRVVRAAVRSHRKPVRTR